MIKYLSIFLLALLSFSTSGCWFSCSDGLIGTWRAYTHSDGITYTLTYVFYENKDFTWRYEGSDGSFGVSGGTYSYNTAEIALTILSGNFSGETKLFSYKLDCNTLIIPGLDGQDAVFKNNISYLSLSY